MVKIYNKNNKYYISGHSENKEICEKITLMLKKYEKHSTFKLILINKLFNTYLLEFNKIEEEQYILSLLENLSILYKDNIRIIK